MNALMIIRGVRGVDDGILYPDGTVFAWEDFQAVSGFQFPDGVKRIEYIPGVRLSYFTVDGQGGPDFPFEGTWETGDRLLANQQAYLAEIEARRPLPPPPPTQVDRFVPLKQALDDMLSEPSPNLQKMRIALSELRKTLAVVGVLLSLSSPAWSMEHFLRPIQDQNGRALVGATVTVYAAGTTTLAQLYSDDGVTAKANPFTTGLDGLADFYAANGRYDLTIRKTGYPSAYFDPLKTKGMTLTDPDEIAAGGSASVGSAGAIQASDGAGGLADSGCTAVSGQATCPNGFRSTGAGLGYIDVQEGTPTPGESAGLHRIAVDSATNRIATYENGGSVKDYLATADTQTVTGKTIDGASNTIVLSDDYWWDTAGNNAGTAGPVFNLPSTNAATAGADTGTNQVSAYMGFADAANQSFYGSFILPANYAGTGVSWNFRYWMDAGTTGAVGLCVQLVRAPVNSSRDPAFPALSTSNCTSNTVPGTAGQPKVASISNVTCTACVAGDEIMFRVSRDGNGTVVTDSATGNVRMTKTGPSYAKSY